MSEKSLTVVLFVLFMICGALSAVLLILQGHTTGLVAVTFGTLLGIAVMKWKEHQ